MYQDTQTFDAAANVILFPVRPRKTAMKEKTATLAQEVLHPSFIKRIQRALHRLSAKPDDFRIGDYVYLTVSDRHGWIYGGRPDFGPKGQTCYFIQVENGGPRVPAYPEYLEHAEWKRKP